MSASPKLMRFGVSMEPELLKRFDGFIRRAGYKNRSEAIRDLIRNEFVKETWKDNARVAGVIILVYDHHQRALVGRLLEIQHAFQGAIVSTQHIHLDHHHCLEIIVARERAFCVQKLHDRLRALKGVRHAALSVTAAGSV